MKTPDIPSFTDPDRPVTVRALRKVRGDLRLSGIAGELLGSSQDAYPSTITGAVEKLAAFTVGSVAYVIQTAAYGIPPAE